MIFDHKVLHPMNTEAVDEYVDDDDPGYDTYVVNEENFVASCQELARLNEFPKRAIKPDSGADMAFRERHRKAQLLKLEQQRGKMKKQVKKPKGSDSAQLLKELAKRKEKGVDVNDSNLAQ